jgi:hypothetical protein
MNGPSQYVSIKVSQTAAQASSSSSFGMSLSSTPADPLSASSSASQVFVADLCSELVSRGNGKRIKDWKGHLTMLRHLTVYLSPRDRPSVDVMEALSRTLQVHRQHGRSSTYG